MFAFEIFPSIKFSANILVVSARFVKSVAAFHPVLALHEGGAWFSRQMRLHVAQL